MGWRVSGGRCDFCDRLGDRLREGEGLELLMICEIVASVTDHTHAHVDHHSLSIPHRAPTLLVLSSPFSVRQPKEARSK